MDVGSLKLDNVIGITEILAFFIRCSMHCCRKESLPFFIRQDIACLALGSASWSLATGGFSAGTERGGGIILAMILWV